MHFPCSSRNNQNDDGAAHVEYYRFDCVAFSDSQARLSVFHRRLEDHLREDDGRRKHQRSEYGPEGNQRSILGITVPCDDRREHIRSPVREGQECDPSQSLPNAYIDDA